MMDSSFLLFFFSFFFLSPAATVVALLMCDCKRRSSSTKAWWNLFLSCKLTDLLTTQRPAYRHKHISLEKRLKFAGISITKCNYNNTNKLAIGIIEMSFRNKKPCHFTWWVGSLFFHPPKLKRPLRECQFSSEGSCSLSCVRRVAIAIVVCLYVCVLFASYPADTITDLEPQKTVDRLFWSSQKFVDQRV